MNRAVLIGLTCSLLVTLPSSARPHSAQPLIEEFGPTFRNRLGGIAIAPDGAIWASEQDGAVRLARNGDILQLRRSDDTYCAPLGIGIGPDGAVWTDGCDRLLRFQSGRVSAHRLAGVNWHQAFAVSSAGIYYSGAFFARGVLRIDKRGQQRQILADLRGVTAAAADSAGVLWLALRFDPKDQLVRYADGHISRHIAAGYLSTHPLGNHLTVTRDGSLVADVTMPTAARGVPATALIRVSPRGEVRELLRLSNGSGYWQPIGGIAVAPDDSIWFTEIANNRVGHVLADGTFREYRSGIPAGASPLGIAADRDGSVWFTDSMRATIMHLAPNGQVRVFGNGLSPINIPGGPVVTSDGAVWFRETLSWHPRITRIARDGSFTEFRDPIEDPASTLQAHGSSVIAIGSPRYETPGSSPRFPAMLLDPTGKVQPFDTSGCLVAAADIACLPLLRSRGILQTRDASPSSVILGPDGNLWFTDSVHSLIGRVSGDGVFSFYTRGLTRWHSGPQHIAVGPDGALWFTEIRDRVGRITMDGHITEFSAGIPFRSFIGGIVAGRDGNLWFTLYHGNELARMTLDGKVTRYRDGIFPSRGNDDTIDSVPSTDREGHIWFNEPQGGRLARATLPSR